MACVEKLECKDCGSSDSRQVFYNEGPNTYTSFCFAGCWEAKGNPYKDGEVPEFTPKTPEEIAEEIQSLRKCNVFKGMGQKQTFRGLPGKCFASWGIRLLVSEYDGITPYATAFPYSDEGDLVGWKVTPLKKKDFWSVGATKGADPFGFERAMKIGGKRLYITEGEWDAVALDYCLVISNKNSAKFARKAYPVISLSQGAGSMAQNLKKIRKRIKNRFTEIVVVMDNDKWGLAAEKVAQTLFPDVLRCSKPQGCKDANDAVKKGMSMDMARMAQWEAHKPPIEGVVRVSDVLARALEKVEFGLSYPMEELTELTYGQKFSDAVCLGAGVGTGKTVTAHEFGAHNMNVHGVPCFMVLLEEQNHMTVKNICSKIDNIPYNNPKVVYDVDRFTATAEGLDDKLILWESEADQTLRFDMDEIISAIRFNNLEYGCRFAYIDNVTRLVDHLPPSEANEFINKYASEIEGLATQLDMHIMVYSHLNPSQSGHSHEEGAAVYASQFTGSRGVMRSFPTLMSFRRNKHADESTGRSKNNSIISVIKDRRHGNEADIRTQYHPETGRLHEYHWEGELENEFKGRK